MLKLFAAILNIIHPKVNTINIFLTKTTAAQNNVALSYCRLRGLYFLAVVFAATIVFKDSREQPLTILFQPYTSFDSKTELYGIFHLGITVCA